MAAIGSLMQQPPEKYQEAITGGYLLKRPVVFPGCRESDGSFKQDHILSLHSYLQSSVPHTSEYSQIGEDLVYCPYSDSFSCTLTEDTVAQLENETLTREQLTANNLARVHIFSDGEIAQNYQKSKCFDPAQLVFLNSLHEEIMSYPETIARCIQKLEEFLQSGGSPQQAVDASQQLKNTLPSDGSFEQVDLILQKFQESYAKDDGSHLDVIDELKALKKSFSDCDLTQVQLKTLKESLRNDENNYKIASDYLKLKIYQEEDSPYFSIQSISQLIKDQNLLEGYVNNPDANPEDQQLIESFRDTITMTQEKIEECNQKIAQFNSRVSNEESLGTLQQQLQRHHQDLNQAQADLNEKLPHARQSFENQAVEVMRKYSINNDFIKNLKEMYLDGNHCSSETFSPDSSSNSWLKVFDMIVKPFVFLFQLLFCFLWSHEQR